MDAADLSFPDESFDVVVAQYVITTVPDPEATLDEFARVLKPGGEIVLVSRVGAEAGLRRSLEQWFAPAARKLGWRTEFAWARYLRWAERTKRHPSRRAPGDAAVRPVLAHPLRQGRGWRGQSRSVAPGERRLLGKGTGMKSFLETLRMQRWDDHRYYHHSRINQALHLVSALSFVCAYILVFSDPALAVLIGWLVGDDDAAGRAFLLRAARLRPREPGDARVQGRDQGRLQSAAQGRADVDLGGVAARRSWSIPPCSGSSRPMPNMAELVRHVALIWLFVGGAGLVFRTVQLFFIKDVESGLAWMVKILTDPFHDIMLYWKAPLYLMRGELYDNMAPEPRG